ncbi:MAG: flagellar biosynthesis protein FliQ [Oscillospiraceae bacterium]|nr:flagellar biosynthesis protein FliQ [Oscillospiraceae bacterium]
MTQDLVMEIFREAVMLAFKLALPVLLVAMIVGLVIAILQAATQIHEQTISFAPKAVAVGLTLFFMAPWMTSECIDFVNFIFEKMAHIPIT